MIASVGAGLTGARAWAQVRGERGWAYAKWQNTWSGLRPTDGLEWTGLWAMAFACVLLSIAPYFARSRRRLLMLAGCIVFLGVGGYVLYDFSYVAVNLRLLGNTHMLRENCEQWMRDGAPVERGSTYKYSLSRDELPEAMRGMQMMEVIVHTDGVLLFFLRGSHRDIVVYVPHGEARGSSGESGELERDRRTAFPGFYKMKDAFQ